MASRGSVDDDDYWETSKVSKLKSYGINQFDDNTVSFKSVFKYLDSCNPDEDDDIDVINWDGSKPTKVETPSARHTPGIVSPAAATSSDFFSKTSQGGPRPNRPQVVRDPELSALNIEDVISSHKPVGAKTDAAKLEAEVNYLRRTLQDARSQRWDVLPVKQVIRRMIFGQAYTLELYKSKEQKLELIDEAIRWHDGDTIITVILFLRDTVKPSIFNMELMQRPVAIDHYVSYLNRVGDVSKLMDVYGLLGRSEEAAMTKFKQAVSVKDPEKKGKSLEVCKQAHFVCEPALSHDASLIEEHIVSLTQQLAVDKADIATQRQGTNAVMKQFPRSASVIDQPVITWLYYCCLYHYDLPPNNFASPASIRKVHKLTEKQFLWTALQARAKLKAWNDIESLFMTKGWLGSTRMKCPLGFHKVVPVLHQLGAPREVLNKYCHLIEDTDLKLQIGEKYNCHEAVIETLVQLRDRQQLKNYHSKLKPNSQEWFYAGDMLRNNNTKWKN